MIRQARRRARRRGRTAARAAARSAPAAIPTPASGQTPWPPRSRRAARRRAASARACRRRGRPRTGAAATACEESSAATQITPGAIARSRFGSAPMPSGNRLATMTKKSSAVADVARAGAARAAGRGRPRCSAAASTLELDHAAVAQPGVLVRRIDDGAAARRHGRAISSSVSSAAAASSAVNGSSSSQSGTDAEQRSRASAARRRWPCESLPHRSTPGTSKRPQRRRIVAAAARACRRAGRRWPGSPRR